MANQYERMRPPTDRRGNKILSEFQQNVKLQKNPEMVSKNILPWSYLAKLCEVFRVINFRGQMRSIYIPNIIFK